MKDRAHSGRCNAQSKAASQMAPDAHAHPEAHVAAPLVILHAYLAGVALFGLMPAAVLVARYARGAHAGAPPSANAPCAATAGRSAPGMLARTAHRVRHWLAEHRVAVHRTMAAASVALLACSTAAVLAHKVMGHHRHLVSNHSKWGLAAYVLAAYQMQGGLTRPPAAVRGAPSSVERGRWWVAHAVGGAGALATGWVSALLALVRSVERDERGARVGLWLVVVCASGLALGTALVEARAYARTRQRGSSPHLGGGRAGMTALSNSEDFEIESGCEAQPATHAQ